MSMVSEFLLPELGENIAGGDVLRVLVKPGDAVARDQAVIELETDKATIEVPAPAAGRVRDVRVSEGQRIKVGDVVLVLESAEAPETGEKASEQDGLGETAVAAPGEPAPAAVPPPEPAAPAVEAGLIELRVPELGENVAGGDVLRLLVARGDRVERDQPVLELETDKATIEVPAAAAGRVAEVRVTEGQKVTVGDVMLVVEASGAAAPEPPAVTVQRVHAVPGNGEPVPPMPVEDKPGMLEDALEEARAEASARTRPASVVEFARPRAPGETTPQRGAAPAAPSVRRAARELGVDIAQVTGSGPGGRISVDDVKKHVKRIMSSGGPRPGSVDRAAPSRPSLPDFSKWGPVERKAMRAVRRKTAEHLSLAWAEIPHVTQFDKADITALDELRQRYADRAAEAGGKLTVTAVAIKVVATALKVFPQFCASVDMAAEEIVYKRYVHIGVAVDTDRGLLVPVIRDADRKSIVQISAELSQVSERARANKLSLDEMQGGTFTITNLGGIGGTHFTPIVNHPEVAILGVSRGRVEPVFIDGEFRPRQLLPLSLSYDHRVIDGADGIRFLRWVVEALEQPFLLSLEG